MYWDKEDGARAFDRLDQVEGEARAYLKRRLDEYHGEERSPRYYEILTGYWLRIVSHAILLALESQPCSSRERGSRMTLPVFNTETDFIDYMISNAGFHSWLRSLLEVETAEHVTFETDTAVIVRGQDRALSRLRRWLKRVAGGVGNSEAVLVCSPYAKCSVMQWVMFVLRARKVMRWDDLENGATLSVPVDHNWRLATFGSTQPERDYLLGAIKRLVPLLIPVVYLEAFAELRRSALKMQIGKPKVFYTANALYRNTRFKLLAAEYEGSTLLLGHQHGGCYGTDLRHSPEEYERSICDFFYTWGWDGGTGDTRVLSPPAFKRSTRKKRWSLMFCLGDFPKTRFRIQFFPVADGATRTIRHTVELARQLSTMHSGGVLIRFPPVAYDRGWFDELRSALPYAHVDQFEKTALERFTESQIVFHNYISTGWLESTWLDVPTFALYDPEVSAFRGEAVRHIVSLEKWGLLQRSASAAAEFYASVRHDIGGWWNQQGFRAARAEFLHQYVRVNAGWQREWIREFDWVLENRTSIISKRRSGISGFAARHETVTSAVQ